MRHLGTAVWIAILAVAGMAILGGYLSGVSLRPRTMPLAVRLPEIVPQPMQRALYGARGLDVPLEPYEPSVDDAFVPRPAGWAPERSPGQREIVRLAVVIRGIGEDRTLEERFEAIPYPLTFAVAAPQGTAGRPVRADRRALLLDLDPPVPASKIGAALADLHAGGVLTPLSMGTAAADALARSLASAGAFAIDGMADGTTAIYGAARARGVPAASRDVLIDAREEEPYIRYMLRESARLARRTGAAIAIGHAYPETYEALRLTLPQLGADAIRIVPAGELAR